MFVLKLYGIQKQFYVLFKKKIWCQNELYQTNLVRHLAMIYNYRLEIHPLIP